MTDTSSTAAQVQLQVLRAMNPARRLVLALEMSLAARALNAARLQTEHPDWPEPERIRRLPGLSFTAPASLRPRVTAAEVFGAITGPLDASGIPYMLTGSFASAYYGRPRATQDLDFVIAASPSQMREFLSRLPAHRFYADEQAALDALQHESQFNVIDLSTGWKADLICMKSRPFSRTEFDRRVPAEVEGVALFIASAEDVVLAKLEWARLGGSLRQIEDVAGILELRSDRLDFDYIERWVPILEVNEQWIAARKQAQL